MHVSASPPEPVTADAVVRLRGVSYSRGRTPVLKGIDLVVGKGEILGIIGPNGGGKTSLLRLMLGLERPDEGTVELFGQPLARFRDWTRVAYVAQHATHFDPNFPATVRELVLLGRAPRRGLLHWFTREDHEVAAWAIDHSGLKGYEGRRVSDLSGGEKQRVFMAKALAAQAELLILDEPTAGVDAESQRLFYNLLHDLNAEHGITILLVSHDLSVIHTHVEKVACVNRTLVYHGHPRALEEEGVLRRLYGADRIVVSHGEHVIADG
jgi:zinc transport system ATP-binding protein